jgi:hypothetical protein
MRTATDMARLRQMNLQSALKRKLRGIFAARLYQLPIATLVREANELRLLDPQSIETLVGHPVG